MQGSHRPSLYIAVALALLTLVLVEINVYVFTDREQIEELIHKVAKNVEQNDFNQIQKVIHPTATELKRITSQASQNYKFLIARITGIKQIQVDRQASPPKATAEFFAAVTVSSRESRLNGRGFVRVTFLENDGQWLVQEYTASEPTAGFRANVP